MRITTSPSVRRRAVAITFGLLVAFPALPAILAPASFAQVVRQVSDFKTGIAGPGAMDDAGTVVFSGTSTNQDGANPNHEFRLVRFDPVSGTLTPTIFATGGVTGAVAVSDDGLWLAFASPADLTGANPDRSPELFLASADGTTIRQLTDDPRVNAGSVGQVAFAGNGQRVAFVANTDPLGSNPDARPQIFVIEADGTGLAQLTTAATGRPGSLAISDDGARIVFSHTADFTGGNADGSSEIFAIGADGSDLRQLTTTIDFDASAATLSGNGAWIAFNSAANYTGNNPDNQTEIFAIGYDGTGLVQVTRTTALLEFGEPSALAPSITDDGGKIFFFSNHYRFPFTNLDSNFEIWSVNRDGSSLTALTSTALVAGCVLPTVSGDGSRVTFYTLASFGSGSNPDGNPELYAMTGTGGSKVQLSTTTYSFNGSPDIAPDGSLVVFVNDPDPLFGSGEIWRVGADGSGVAQVTSIAGEDPSSLSLAADNQTIAFTLGGEVHVVGVDGTGLQRLTNGAGGSARTSFAKDSRRIVFDSVDDLTGGNADASREIFRIEAGGAGLAQITSAVAGESRAPRASADGAWVVFETSANLDGTNPDGTFEIARASADGLTLALLTADAAVGSGSPDIAGDGGLVVWSSSANPVGTNPEGNGEIFLWDAATGTTRQLTVTAEGSSFAPRIAADGSWVTFQSSAPLFEDDPDRPVDLYRVRVADGRIERIGGLRAGGFEGALASFGIGFSSQLAVSSDGAQTVFAGVGDSTRDNPDALPEVWVIDRRTPASIRIGKAAPTLVSWPVVSGPLRYDIIRGDVAELARDGGAGTDLGAVVCLENDSPDNDTLGFEDAEQPGVGDAFFYLYRGTQGLDDGPGSYGTASTGGERLPATGGCAP